MKPVIDIDKVRLDTKGVDGKIFLNSAGASLMPRQVIEAMTGYLATEEEFGGYRTEHMKAEQISAFYTEAARLLNCPEKCIAFAYNATDAFAKALSSIPFRNSDYILTSNDDYVSNQIAFMSLQKRLSIQVIRANNLANGDLDLNHFEAMLQQYRPALVSLTHIPTNSGMIQDAAAVGKLCRTYDTWYLLDACQSIGQIPVDAQALDCDFLSATGRKFMRGPRGTGFLYVSETVLDAGLEPLIPDMRGAEWTGTDQYTSTKDAKRFELFETSFASLCGLAAAMKYANDIGMEQIFARNQELSKLLRSRLADIPGVTLLDKGSHLSNIITFHWKGLELEHIEAKLNAHRVMYSVSRKKNALIDMDKKGVDWVVRFSPHYFNTTEEIEQVSSIVAALGQQQA